MAIRIKDVGSLAQKFKMRASAAQGDYKDGVLAAGPDWEANTKAGEENYKIAVNQAAAEGRFGKGVAKAGAAKYVKKAGDLGPQRYATGIGAAEGDWMRGVQPHLQAMASANLPPRRPTGDPGNYARVQFIANLNRDIAHGK